MDHKLETQLKAITAEEMRIAAAGVVPLPIEQAAVWEDFAEQVDGPLFGRYLWTENGKSCAVIALYRATLTGGIPYLIARHAPVWLKEASPAREAAFREDLKAEIKKRDPKISFVRLNAIYSAPDLEEPLQGITYDRTVIIDCGNGKAEKILQTMDSEGRRGIRRATKKLAEVGAQVYEETHLDQKDFHEYYEVLKETAQRDGFRPHPESYYWNFLQTLGAEHARLFCVRVPESPEATAPEAAQAEGIQIHESTVRTPQPGKTGPGRLVAWDLVTVYDQQATAFFGASTTADRPLQATSYLDFCTAQLLGSEKVKGLDLMGAHSPRVPQLYTVGMYKRRFASHYTDIPGGWDMPLRSGIMPVLRTALKTKRGLSSVVKKLRKN
ncbi:lipid II:glycine glycyltransferase FemX [Boudabousia liubingyangii]|nr:GNAT family N-acetyltransferase [Boudabousia liubingyangii]